MEKTTTSRYIKLLNCFRFFKISNGFKITALNTQPKISKKLNLKVLMNGTTWLFRKYRNTLKKCYSHPLPCWNNHYLNLWVSAHLAVRVRTVMWSDWWCLGFGWEVPILIAPPSTLLTPLPLVQIWPRPKAILYFLF